MDRTLTDMAYKLQTSNLTRSLAISTCAVLLLSASVQAQQQKPQAEYWEPPVQTQEPKPFILEAEYWETPLETLTPSPGVFPLQATIQTPPATPEPPVLTPEIPIQDYEYYSGDGHWLIPIPVLSKKRIKELQHWKWLLHFG